MCIRDRLCAMPMSVAVVRNSFIGSIQESLSIALRAAGHDLSLIHISEPTRPY